MQAVHSSLEPCSPTDRLSLVLLHIIHIIEVHQGDPISTTGGILCTDNASICRLLHHLHLSRRAQSTSHHCNTRYNTALLPQAEGLFRDTPPHPIKSFQLSLFATQLGENSLQQPTFSSSSSSSFSLGPPNLPEQTVTKQRQLSLVGSIQNHAALHFVLVPRPLNELSKHKLSPPPKLCSFGEQQQSGRNELLPRADLEQTGERPPDLAGRRILSHPRQPEPARQFRPLSQVSHDCSMHEQ